MDFFSDQMRRDPFPIYDQLRANSPVFHVPPPFNAWLIFDYDGVRRALSDHETFSSAVPAPPHWFIFADPPSHSKLRGLISKAFTPRVVAALEPRIQQLSKDLLRAGLERGEMDIVTDYAAPLPIKVISEMIGIPGEEWARFKRWSDGIMKLSYARSGEEEQAMAMREFHGVTQEMGPFVQEMIEARRKAPKSDLLTRLIEAEIDGERLSSAEILGFFQLLIVAGQETTTNLISNAILCLVEHPGQLARLRSQPQLLGGAIEESLRYRSPVQWMMRTPKREVEMHGQVLHPRVLVLPMIGSANRDAKHFPDAARFDLGREPNPHLAFGHGIHACLGSALARMEARIALTDIFLESGRELRLVEGALWEPRKALQVYGPERLRVKFEGSKR